MRRALLPLVAVAAACAGPPAEIEAIIEVGGLDGQRVLLEITDEQGDPVAVQVESEAGARTVETPFELPCPGGQCALDVGVPRGTLSFQLRVLGRDRCGVEDTLYTVPALENPVEIGPFDLAVDLTFLAPDLSLDDDEDDIPNAFEPALCGRFDLADLDAAPSSCAAGHPCCELSPLIGDHARFDGEGAPFRLAATELTVGVAARCVAAGGCPRTAESARFLSEAAAAAFDLPASSLRPEEADEVCAWLGGALPTDAQWDHAAAFVDVDTRADFPWGDDANPGCQPGEPLSANFAAAGVACFDAVQPVGSFPGSFVERGDGAPIADLAGNLVEWTSDGDAWVLRGGSFASPLDLLRNDIRFRVDADDDLRIEALVESGTVGARCVFDAGRPRPSPEPPCPASP